MSGWTFPYSSGFELTKEAMKIALGIPSDFSDINEIPSAKFSHERAFISIPGKIKKIYGEEKAWASPFFKNIFFRKNLVLFSVGEQQPYIIRQISNIIL